MSKHLTVEDVEALSLILDTFAKKYPPKFRKGAAENEGCITDLTALDLAYNLLEEAMDAVAYAVILIKKLQYHEEE